MRRHVYYYTLLSSGFQDAAPLLGGDAGSWLPPPAEARDGGWAVELRADGALPAPLDHVTAIVSVGQPALRGTRLLRAVSWRAATAGALFPKFEGDLELDALGGAGCHLSLMGTYRPPLSVVGGAGDALLGHRVAEACVRRFVNDLAAGLVGAVERS